MYLHELIDLLSNINVEDDKEVEVFIESHGARILVNSITLETYRTLDYVDETELITRTIIIKK